MSSRIFAFFNFLIKIDATQKIAQELGVEKATIVGRIMIVWAHILDAKVNAVSPNTLKLLWGIGKQETMRTLPVFEKAGLCRFYQDHCEFYSPIVRHGALGLETPEGVRGWCVQSRNKERNITPTPLISEQIAQCTVVWLATLKHFGVNRGLSGIEEMQIVRGIKGFGFEFTLLALEGMRYEPKTDGFNPAKYLMINRVLDRNKIDKFANLASMKENEQTAPDENVESHATKVLRDHFRG